MQRLKTVVIYLLLIGATIAAFLVIRAFGDRLPAASDPAPAVGSTSLRVSPDTLFHVLLALVAVILASRAVALVLRQLGQPPVIGEILAGIMLGPSLLGRVAPESSQFLFPPDVIPLLGVVSQIGIILYMFLVGLKLDIRELRVNARVSVAVSQASIAAPMLLGAGLALWLYPRFSSSSVSFTSFALFIGVSMSITAFPVLARILTERGISATQLGAIALACAAVGDVISWCLLAFLVATVRSVPGDVLITVGLTAGFILVMGLAVHPMALLL
jgi:Kef-type K+ transport system membrane component KefB